VKLCFCRGYLHSFWL